MVQLVSGMMTAISISEFGGPDVLKPVKITIPQPKDGEVLIRVAAAGVNRPDQVQREGKYPPPPGAPDTLGLEIAGEIVAVGENVGPFEVGGKVCALVSGGGYAEYCLAPALQCLPIPGDLSMVEAAALPETFFTVWSNIFDRAHFQAGESFLVHGGTSGIGTTAIQLVRAMGGHVYATAGTDAKCQACLNLGAEAAFNYKSSDFEEEVRRATGGKGIDVILDMVGGDYIQKNINSLAPDGRLVQIAFLKSSKAEVNLLQMMVKRLTLTGSTLRSRDIAFKGAIATKLREKVWPLLKSRRISPVIDQSFPLARAADAHHRLEESAHIGKIVLVME